MKQEQSTLSKKIQEMTERKYQEFINENPEEAARMEKELAEDKSKAVIAVLFMYLKPNFYHPTKLEHILLCKIVGILAKKLDDGIMSLMSDIVRKDMYRKEANFHIAPLEEETKKDDRMDKVNEMLADMKFLRTYQGWCNIKDDCKMDDEVISKLEFCKATSPRFYKPGFNMLDMMAMSAATSEIFQNLSCADILFLIHLHKKDEESEGNFVIAEIGSQDSDNMEEFLTDFSNLPDDTKVHFAEMMENIFDPDHMRDILAGPNMDDVLGRNQDED